MLRAKFNGQPEHVINYFFLMAEDIREHLASLGFRKLEDAVGRADLLEKDPDVVRSECSFFLFARVPRAQPGREPPRARGVSSAQRGTRGALLSSGLIARCFAVIFWAWQIIFDRLTLKLGVAGKWTVAGK